MFYLDYFMCASLEIMVLHDNPYFHFIFGLHICISFILQRVRKLLFLEPIFHLYMANANPSLAYLMRTIFPWLALGLTLGAHTHILCLFMKKRPWRSLLLEEVHFSLMSIM